MGVLGCSSDIYFRMGLLNIRRFNVTGLCVPEEDYMVDISGKITQIRKLVDNRCYFTINRARQYGKTTTLACLEKALKNDYLVILSSFQGIGDTAFDSEANFCQIFIELIKDAMEIANVSDECKMMWPDSNVTTFSGLSKHITKMCKPRHDGSSIKAVLMIDEVDKTSNNRVFLHFLEMLRQKFLDRKNRRDYTFHSVILAGVYDIKNIKLKMAGEGTYNTTQLEGKVYNSPWNIAVDFEVDMSFNPAEIATMLAEYESDHKSGMDIPAISSEIYNYTSGYPYLVSRICQRIDHTLNKNWTIDGVRDAVQVILSENNTLFDDMGKNLENNEDLRDYLHKMLFVGMENGFSYLNPVMNLGYMYGYLTKSENNKAIISNKIFEIIMYDYFLSKNATSMKPSTGVLQHDVVKDGRFDMELCLLKFADHYAEIWSGRDEGFIEREGRLLFLSYLKPLINGNGFYHVESQFADFRRMDLVVDYGREEFILELKLWRGDAAHEKAYEQLYGYIAKKGARDGYLLTFDFRKNTNKQPYAKWVEYEGVRIFDVLV